MASALPLIAVLLLTPLATLQAAEPVPIQPQSNNIEESVRSDAAEAGNALTIERMRQVHDEVKTPFKDGVVIRGEEKQLVDSPSVFCKDGQWYMVYTASSGTIGYENHLARSANLLHWEKLGKILSFPAEGWDRWQRAGHVALGDTTWGGRNELQTFDGRFGMSCLGGARQGCETDPRAIGLATSKDLKTRKNEGPNHEL